MRAVQSAVYIFAMVVTAVPVFAAANTAVHHILIQVSQNDPEEMGSCSAQHGERDQLLHRKGPES